MKALSSLQAVRTAARYLDKAQKSTTALIAFILVVAAGSWLAAGKLGLYMVLLSIVATPVCIVINDWALFRFWLRRWIRKKWPPAKRPQHFAISRAPTDGPYTHSLTVVLVRLCSSQFLISLPNQSSALLSKNSVVRCGLVRPIPNRRHPRPDISTSRNWRREIDIEEVSRLAGLQPKRSGKELRCGVPALRERRPARAVVRTKANPLADSSPGFSDPHQGAVVLATVKDKPFGRPNGRP